jgi:hypothetical protein
MMSSRVRFKNPLASHGLRTALLALLYLPSCLSNLAAAADPPKLVVAITIDQFRYDYLTRFRGDYHYGLDRLLKNGAVFVDADLEHYPTVTAVGHATLLSGATPAISGIIGNEWFDIETGKSVTSVSDETVKQVGGSGSSSASPHNLLVNTIGDELKSASNGAARVIGLSLKDRAAILPVGRSANAAYWYDPASGDFITSSYYQQVLPDWVQQFNRQKLTASYAGVEWKGPDPQAAPLMKLASIGPKLFADVYGSPFGNELLERFAEEAIPQEHLGQGRSPDLLSISFSSNDAVGHTFGPDSPQVQDLCLRTDAILGRLLAAIDKQVGLRNSLIVLTADHGVAPLPETQSAHKLPGGRLSTADLVDSIQGALARRFGSGKWILSAIGTSIYLNRSLIRENNLDSREVERIAAQAALAVPHVLQVYTRSELILGHPAADAVGMRIARSFNARRSADLEILLEPYWITSKSGTTHGTPYEYDSQIPLIFFGASIRPGFVYMHAALNDVAPTLAALLGIPKPAGSAGRVLNEIIDSRRE